MHDEFIRIAVQFLQVSLVPLVSLVSLVLLVSLWHRWHGTVFGRFALFRVLCWASSKNTPRKGATGDRKERKTCLHAQRHGKTSSTPEGFGVFEMFKASRLLFFQFL